MVTAARSRPPGRRSVPERGDIIAIDLEPARGREIRGGAARGERPALVLSPRAFNALAGIVIAVPITQGGVREREHGWAVSLSGCGTETQGVVLASQIRTLDWAERRGRIVESVPAAVLDEVLARLAPLIGFPDD